MKRIAWLFMLSLLVVGWGPIGHHRGGWGWGTAWRHGARAYYYGETRQYYTTPGSLSGQTVCEPGKIGAKFSPVFWHDGEAAYGPKYAGTVCITLE